MFSLSGLTADSDGCISEAGKNTAYGEENTDGFPAGDLKRMHIKAAHDGGGREKQPENVYMGKTAHAFPCRTQKEDQGELAGIVRLRFQDILYAEHYQHQIYVYATGGKKYVTRQTFREFTASLTDGLFFLCSRGILVKMENAALPDSAVPGHGSHPGHGRGMWW